jgi:hypothetical protein
MNIVKEAMADAIPAVAAEGAPIRAPVEMVDQES